MRDDPARGSDSDAQLLRASALFDASYYLDHNPDVAAAVRRRAVPWTFLDGYSRWNRWACWMGHRPLTLDDARRTLPERERDMLAMLDQIDACAAADASGTDGTASARTPSL